MFLGRRTTDILGLRDLGATGDWAYGACFMWPWHLWALAPQSLGISEPWGHGALDSRSLELKGPWAHNALGSRGLGFMWHWGHGVHVPIPDYMYFGEGGQLIPWGHGDWGSQGLRVIEPWVYVALGSQGLAARAFWSRGLGGHRTLGVITPWGHGALGILINNLIFPSILYFPKKN